MRMRLLAHEYLAIDVRERTPAETLTMLCDRLRAMVRTNAPGRKAGIAVLGLPARVDVDAGIPVRPPIMPGWDGYPAGSEFSRLLGCENLVENDVNLRALGESAVLSAKQRPLLAIKVGTGIGAGLIDAKGGIYHGFDGAAGEVGHIPVRRAPAVQCACGNVGCIESVASTPAVIRRLKELAPELIPMDTPDDLVRHMRAGDPVVARVVREAGTVIGEAIAIMCNVVNPGHVVLSGSMCHASDDLLAAVRIAAYEIARPLATRHLVISRSRLGELDGVVGAMVLGIRRSLSPGLVLTKPAP